MPGMPFGGTWADQSGPQQVMGANAGTMLGGHGSFLLWLVVLGVIVPGLILGGLTVGGFSFVFKHR